MEVVRIDEVENDIQPAAVMRHLTDALGLTDVAINYYELEPGDSFAFAYHKHGIQEEVFYIQSGSVVFETEEGSIEVNAGEIVRFGREEFQRGWNRGVERVVALALGAPLEYGEQVRLRDCPSCEQQTHSLFKTVDDGDRSAKIAYCAVCGTENGRWYRGSMPGEVP